ncbi:hypothetical protein D3C87_1750200 [compost metagenome]
MVRRLSPTLRPTMLPANGARTPIASTLPSKLNISSMPRSGKSSLVLPDLPAGSGMRVVPKAVCTWAIVSPSHTPRPVVVSASSPAPAGLSPKRSR